jgi:hypothetical protein
MRRVVAVLLLLVATSPSALEVRLKADATGAKDTFAVRQKADARAKDEHWVPTWGTAQQLIKVTPPATPPATATPPPAAPATTTPAPFRVTTLNNQTVRMILRTSIGGRRARVKLSNAFGMTPVAVGSAHVARRGTDAGIMAGTDRPLTFGGKSTFTLRPGVVIVSDPVDLDVPPLSDLAISLFFPTFRSPPTI